MMVCMQAVKKVDKKVGRQAGSMPMCAALRIHSSLALKISGAHVARN